MKKIGKLLKPANIEGYNGWEVVFIGEFNHPAANSAVAEITRQFEAFKAEDAGAETRRGKSADKSADTIASDQYLHNKIADENI
jgi:hypothetical protein